MNHHTQSPTETLAAGPGSPSKSWTSAAQSDARAGDTRGEGKGDGPAAPLPFAPHPHLPFAALVRGDRGGLEIGWFATGAEARAASKHRELVMGGERAAMKRRPWVINACRHGRREP